MLTVVVLIVDVETEGCGSVPSYLGDLLLGVAVVSQFVRDMGAKIIGKFTHCREECATFG